MRKRRLVLAGVVVLLAVAGCLILRQLFSKSCPVNLANHWRMQGRETLAEVEVILGGPPGDYSSTPGQKRFHLNVSVNNRAKTWVSDEGIVIVDFDAEGQVEAWHIAGPDIVTPGPIDRLRGWLGW